MIAVYPLVAALVGTFPCKASPPAVAAAPLLLAQARPGDSTIPDIDYETLAKKNISISFDFSKAEVEDIVKVVSKIKKANFIIPEALKSKRITILTPRKIKVAEAWQVFISALAANDIALVAVGGFYKLMPTKEAIKDVIPTCIGPDDVCPQFTEQIITVLIRLKYIDANQINPVIKNLTGKGAEVTVFQPTNSIIISEIATNLARVQRIIEALDQPGFDDELRIVQIMHAAASEIASKLSEVFDVAGRGGAAPRGAAGKAAPRRPPDKNRPDGSGAGGGDEEDEVQISKIIPDDRTNQLIIKANARSFEAIKNLIAKLDVPVEDQGNVHVYYLENADAEDLASTLQSLAQGQSTSTRPTTPRPTGGKQSSAASGAPGGSAVLFQGEVKITADKSTNALIIMATGDDYKSMRILIDQLDMPRRQVYVEAAILEVTVSDKDEWGLNFHSPLRFSKGDLGNELGGGRTFGYVQSAQSDGGISPTIGALADPASVLGVAGGSVIGMIGKGITIPVGDSSLEVPAFGVVLKWLETSSDANILSNPHILTTDNEEATIEVGQKIPFRRGTTMPSLGGLGGLGGTGAAASALGAYSNMFSSTDRIDVSLKLTITPHVNERDKVRLDIDQKIEDVVGIDEATQQPITANRSAKTVVVVDDQQTVVIGGLMKDRVSQGASKIPILGDLPIIGYLFRDESQDIEKVNLLLVLTPYIIRDKDDFQRIFERKMGEYEEFAASYYGHTVKYRAHVDYARKLGPLAKLGAAVRSEMNKIENGGSGDGDLLITPEATPDNGDGAIRAPRRVRPRGSDGAFEDGGEPGGEGMDGGIDAAPPEGNDYSGGETGSDAGGESFEGSAPVPALEPGSDSSDHTGDE